MNKSDKLRIAMIGHKHVPSREGGIEVVVEELSKRMVNLGHSVTCLNRGGYHVSGKEFDLYKTDMYKGIKLKTVPTINCRGFSAMSSSVFGSIVTAFGKYDVVHFHAEGPCVMLWFPKLLGKKCVVTIHGLDWKRAKWGKLSSAYIMLGEKCAAKFADEIIVLSRGTQRYFEKVYGRKTYFIPNGVNQPQIREANLIKKKYGLVKDSYILFLGRLVPEKGVHYLIEAFKNIKTDKKLVIAGGSSDTETFTKKIHEMAKSDHRIIFTGFVQGSLLEELYSNAYIYTLPSELEGMPLSLLEAMSYGNCCLVSDIEECTSVVEDKAVIFKKGDVMDLREKLQMLCSENKIVNEKKIVSADYICKKYNWNDVVRRTLALYAN